MTQNIAGVHRSLAVIRGAISAGRHVAARRMYVPTGPIDSQCQLAEPIITKHGK